MIENYDFNSLTFKKKEYLLMLSLCLGDTMVDRSDFNHEYHTLDVKYLVHSYSKS